MKSLKHIKAALIQADHEKVGDLVRQFRQAIDDGNQKAEQSLHEKIGKEVLNIGKPIISDFNKALSAFLKDQAKILSANHDIEVRIVQPGKAVLQHTGSNQSPFACRATFEQYFIVEPPPTP